MYKKLVPTIPLRRKKCRLVAWKGEEKGSGVGVGKGWKKLRACKSREEK